MNVGIILAAGISSRFKHNTPKQFFLIDGKEILQYSIDALDCLDKTFVVTNSEHYQKTLSFSNNVLINDVNCRLESIKVALQHVPENTNKVIVHDAARPFVPKHYIKTLLEKDNAQYYMNLTNGLVKKNNDKYELAKREDFIELCTPQILTYQVFKDAFKYHINRDNCEVLTLNVTNYNLIEGHYKYLRKITTLDDVFTIQDSFQM